MDEITTPPEESLKDRLDRKIEEYEAHNKSLTQPSPEEEQPQQEEEKDEFSDIGDVAREIGSALVGGLQQTGSDLVTLPERAIDMARGEDVGGEDYRPDTDIFGAFENPIETRTWWGGVLKTLVNYGSLAFVPIPGARIGAVGKATGLAQMGRAALVGAKVDLIASGSQQENASGVIATHFPHLRTPLATHDTDHPAMKTLKNVVEGMGIGAVIDGLGMVIKGARGAKGADEALEAARKRNESLKEQTTAKGIDEVAESPGEFRGSANKPVADPPQGAHTSNASAGDVNKQLSRTRNELGAETGSTDSLTRPIELDRIGKGNVDLAPKEIKRIMEEFATTDYVVREVAEAKRMGIPLHDVWADSTASMKEMFEGRLNTELTTREWADDFYKQGIKRKVQLEDGSFEEVEIMDPNMIPAADLLKGSLLKEIRDLGVAGRELQDLYDLGDTDGPAKTLFDKFASLVAITKRSRYFTGYDLQSVKGVDGLPKKAVYEQEVNADIGKSIDAFRTAFTMAGESGDNELFKAYMEVASMLDDVTNLNDLDNFFRKKLRGGMLDGKKQTGELIKELEGVMIHSVLSGPKTPIRAIMGTASATFLRPMATALGATFSGDVVTRKSSLAALNGMMGMLPEAFTLFRKKLDGYFSGDIATIQSRYVERTKADQKWKLYGDWAEKRGSDADKAVFRAANMARAMNDSNYLSYSTKIMAATDDVFGHILARGKMRERAMRESLELASKGEFTEITPAILRKAEEKFAKQILDEDGNIIDDAVKYAKRESTLTKDLEGFSKGLETLFNSNPWAKPFFLFARTGVNGLELTAKYTPGFNFLVKEFNDVAFASVKDVEAGNLTKYGISTFEELQNAKALQNGRLAIGSAVVSMASMMWMSGNMSGDGPTDRQMRQSWVDAGWKPRTFTLGGVQIGYEAFEPFNQIMSTISNVGDHSLLMGDEWTEDQLLKIAMVVGQSAASKSYLTGLQQFVDLFSGQPGQHNRIIASLMNNTLPLSSLRNEIGKLITPHMRELDSGIIDSIRNRNLITENLTDQALPIKYDMLNGRPIKDHDFMTRAFNMFSPIQFNLDQGPGRKLLFRSGYDSRLSVYYAPDNTDLSKLPGVRSKFMKAIGDQNLEAELNKLASEPRIQASIRKMERDRVSGNRDYEPMKAYYHTKVIGALFNKARKRAWATIRNEADVRAAIAESRSERIENRQSQRQTTYGQLEPVLRMNK